MITREQQVTQSVQEFIKAALAANGYPTSRVVVRDAFPSPNERASTLTKTVLALGFNFDDGGRPAELGSNLTRRVYTVEFWVFGLTATEGQNVATVVRAVIEDADLLIPLKDISTVGWPEVDKLIVMDEAGIRITRQVAAEPMPWDANVWQVNIRIEDFYLPSEVN